MKSGVKTSVAEAPRVCDSAPAARGNLQADRCELVTDFRRLEELASDWERLWESNTRAEVFQTFAWNRAWWRSFGHNFKLRSLVVFAGEEVVGIVPLVERDERIQFLGTPEADYADIICEERLAVEVLTLALTTLLDSVPGWKECSFLNLSRHSRLARHYREQPRAIRRCLHCQPAGRLQTIILRNQREEVFKALLGKQHTRRLQNKLRKAGQLQFRHFETLGEAERYLPEFFRQHFRRHAAIGRESSFNSPEAREFIRALIEELGPSGQVRFGVLELDGRPLAWELGFEANGKFLLYQHTFDLDASHYTPGEVLLWYVLDYARQHISREVDFGRGDELYKDRFTNYSRETFRFFLEPRGLTGRIRGFVRSLQTRLLPWQAKAVQIAKSRRLTLRAYRALRMWMIGTAGCIRQARKNGALLDYCWHATKEAFGSLVWSRKSFQVFAAEAGQDRPAPSSAVGVEVDAAQFGDLVELAWEHPEILSLNQLARSRKRLNDGDCAYVVREKSQVVSVWWASSAAHAKADAGSAQRDRDAASPAVAIEEFWHAQGRDLSVAYRLLLTVLTSETAGRKEKILVHCEPDQPELRKELGRQGFLARFRTTRYRVLGRLRHESIREYPAATLSPCKAL